MVLDETLTRIIETIRGEVKEKFDVDISFEEIHVVVDNQIEASKLGFARGISVHWDGFCKFLFTNRYNRKMETIYALNKIDLDSPELTAEEKEAKRTEAIIKSYNKKKALIKEVIPSTRKDLSVSAEEVQDTPVVSKLKISLFTNITKKHR